MRVLAAVVLSFFLASVSYAADLPQGYQAVSGDSSYQSNGTTGTLTAADATTIGQWAGGFNVASGKTFQALLPEGGAHLSRDITSSPSQIFGALNVPRGRFFLVNQNGIYFSSSAQVNAAGIVASTLDISNANFLAHNYRFDQSKGIAVTNNGTIKAGAGGAALIGAHVANNGTITAQESTVALGGGSAVTLTFDGAGGIAIAVDPAQFAAVVRNSGAIRTGGGNVVMTAAAADQFLASAVNQNGIVEAGGSSHPGTISLRGNTVNVNAAVNPGTGGLLNLRGRTQNVNAALDGYYSISAQGDVVNFNRDLGLVSPLLSVSVAAGTIRLPNVVTDGTQMYSTVRNYEGGATTGFLTELNGNLTVNGNFGSIYLLGQQQMNRDITLRTNGAQSTLVLGASADYTPARIDGNYTLTLSSEYLIDIQASPRPGASYDFGTAAAPIGRLYIPEARSAELDNTRIFTRTADLTADNLTVYGWMDTFGAANFTATTMNLEGSLNTHGAALSAKAASIRQAGWLATGGGKVTFNGPTTFDRASLPGGYLKHSLTSGGGSVFVAGPLLLNADSSIASQNGAITLNSTVNDKNWAADRLTLDAGPNGDITVNGGIGYNFSNGTGQRIGALDVVNARNAYFNSQVTAASVTQREGAGTTLFRGKIDANQAAGINLTGNAFRLNGAVSSAGKILINYRSYVTLTGAYSPQPVLKKR